MPDRAQLLGRQVVERGDDAALRRGRLHVGGDAAPRRDQRLELAADPHQRVRHADHDLAAQVRRQRLRHRRRRVPRGGDHDEVAVGGDRRSRRSRAATRAPGDGTRSRRGSPSPGTSTASRSRRRNRRSPGAPPVHSPPARCPRSLRCASARRYRWRRDTTCNGLVPLGPTRLPAHGTARGQEDRHHRRAHRRVARVRGRPDRPRPRAPRSCSPAPAGP